MRSSRVDGCDDGRGLSEEAMTTLLSVSSRGDDDTLMCFVKRSSTLGRAMGMIHDCMLIAC